MNNGLKIISFALNSLNISKKAKIYDVLNTFITDIVIKCNDRDIFLLCDLFNLEEHIINALVNDPNYRKQCLNIYNNYIRNIILCYLTNDISRALEYYKDMIIDLKRKYNVKRHNGFNKNNALINKKYLFFK